MNTLYKLKLLLWLLILTATTQLNANTFYANDMASLKSAFQSVNAGTGGDIIKITGNIQMVSAMVIDGVTYPYVDYLPAISRDVTITADPNPDGSPQYTIDGGGMGYFWIGNPYDASNVTTLKNCTVENLIISNMLMGGLVVTLSDESVSAAKVNNCIALNNSGTGIIATAINGKTIISHCVSKNNDPCGFASSARETIIQDCMTENNKKDGFSVQYPQPLFSSFVTAYAQLYNCTSNRNRGMGILIGDVKNILMNGCSTAGNAGSGIAIEYSDNTGYGQYVISNSSAAGNQSNGFYLEGVSGKIINCTVSHNWKGIYYNNDYPRKVYNSISYNNEYGDLAAYGKETLYLYNTVYDKENEGYAPVEKYNCRTEDPKLSGMTTNGLLTENPDEIAYYGLSEGSSALGFADKNLITRQMLTELPGSTLPEVNDWFNSIITEEYVNNILAYDQVGNSRFFNGNNYDAGSISGTGGKTGIKEIPALQHALLYPNPAGKNCTIAFDMEKSGNVKISIFNISGVSLMKLYDGYVERGNFKYSFDAGSLPAGLYTVLIYTGGKITGERLLIAR